MTYAHDAPSDPILLSRRLMEGMKEALEERFPSERFVAVSDDGDVPEEGHTARALFRAGLSHDALRRVLGQAPAIDWIHTASAGFNWVLIPEVEASDIRLTRTVGAANAPIAEFVLATTLALLKRIPELLSAQAERSWTRLDLDTLKDRTVAIVGAGSIGREAARRFRAFDTRVLGSKRTPEPLPEFDEVVGPEEISRIVASADVVVLSCPLTDETRHLFDAAMLRTMKPSAILVNIARGEVVVESDLIDALRDGTIRAAALDVFDTEPLAEDSPLWSMPNVLVSPHVSYVSPDGMDAIYEEFAVNLARFRRGEPLANEIKSRSLGY